MNAMLLERNHAVAESTPQAALEFNVENRGCLVIIRVRGEATSDWAADLDENLKSSLTPGCSFVLLDLEGVSGIGARGLQTLQEFARRIYRKGGEVWLTGLRPAVWLALHTAELERLFTIRGSVSQALTS